MLGIGCAAAVRRGLRVAVAAAGLALLITGAVLLVRWWHADGAAQAYLDSPCTRRPVPGRCANVAGATVLGTATPVDRAGDVHALVRLTTGTGGALLTVEGIWPNGAFWRMRPGTHVLVIRSGGRPASLRLDPDAAHPEGLRLTTVDSPLADRYLLRDGGVIAAGVGLLALVLVAPVRLSRLTGPGMVGALGDAGLRCALLSFTTVEMLDAATSVAGHHRLLYEAVAVTRAVVARWGDAGFLVVRLPALLLMGILVARLPRRWAVVPAIAATVAVAVVAGLNLRLLASGATG